MSSLRFYLAPASFGCVIAVFFVGCGSRLEGPTRYPVSGKVTFNGKPVPKGMIVLEPDDGRGNSGPGGGAEIINGKYDTRLEAGVVGGPYRVRITGTDGVPATESGETLADGKPLFATYQTTVDFPQEKTVKDFEVVKPAE